ncbi:MAG: TolC family protein, partial [Pseudomonadota bacterium]
AVRFAKDPFSPVDHVALTRNRVDSSFADTRARPAATLAGKSVLTLVECRNVALANNHDIRMARREGLVLSAQESLQKKKILPHMVFSGQLGEADNQRWGYSEPLGQQGILGQASTLIPFSGITTFGSGKERFTGQYSLELNWSPTFALDAYFLSVNSRNMSRDMRYQAVRKTQEVIGSVDAAFFRLLALQEALPLAEKAAGIRGEVVRKRKDLYGRNLIGFEELADAQDKSIRAGQVLSQLTIEVERQRNILASLMGVSPDTPDVPGFAVVGSLNEMPAEHRLFAGALRNLERVGLENRPEPYRAVLKYLNSINDVKRAFVKYCPEITGYFRYTRDKDKFILENEWKDVGVNVRFDLLNLLTAMDESQSARLSLEQADTQIVSLTEKIASQIRAAALKYLDAHASVRSAVDSLRNAQTGLEVARNKHEQGDLRKVQVDEATAEVLANRMRLISAMGEQGATLSELYAALAMNYQEPGP